jgi:hypothetical protein
MAMPLCTRTFALTFLAPVAALFPVVMPTQSTALSPVEIVALQTRFDPSLGSLRAGRVDAPGAFGTVERDELRAAQQRSASLAGLRAGSGPTNDQWTWIAIGAVIVLLIVLL